MLFTPYTFTGKITCHFKWHNADLTSEVTSKVWRQNKEFDSLMSGSTSNLKMYVVKVKKDLFLKVKTRLNWWLHSGKAYASFPNIRQGVHIQQQLCC